MICFLQGFEFSISSSHSPLSSAVRNPYSSGTKFENAKPWHSREVFRFASSHDFYGGAVWARSGTYHPSRSCRSQVAGKHSECFTLPESFTSLSVSMRHLMMTEDRNSAYPNEYDLNELLGNSVG